MKKWIFLILAALLICGGVFGFIAWKHAREERAKELAIAKEREERYLKSKEKDSQTRKVLDRMYKAEENLKKDSPELYKLSTQPAKDK